MQLAKLQFYFKSKGHVTNCHCFVSIVSFLHFVFSSETPLIYLIVSKAGMFLGSMMAITSKHGIITEQNGKNFFSKRTSYIEIELYMNDY